MPADYVACREAMLKEGHPMKEAQRVCAIQYYKKHGHAMPHDAKSGLSAELIPADASEHPMDTADEAIVLNWLYETLKAENRLPQFEDYSSLFKYIKVK